jgi:hypothetical protein
VSQRSIRIDVALAAMDLIAVETESVIEALGFLDRLRDEAFAQGMESIELAGMCFEVGNNGACVAMGSPSGSSLSR